MGKNIGGIVGERLGKTILELGGNNAVMVDETADLNDALKKITFRNAKNVLSKANEFLLNTR